MVSYYTSRAHRATSLLLPGGRARKAARVKEGNIQTLAANIALEPQLNNSPQHAAYHSLRIDLSHKA